MRRYVVTFHNVITDGAGHDRRVLQHRAVVRANSEVGALYEAKALFREAANVADWRLRADTCEAVELSGVADQPGRDEPRSRQIHELTVSALVLGLH